jgi:hypothetical protein
MFNDQNSAGVCGMEGKCSRARGIFGCDTDTCGGETANGYECSYNGWGLKGYPLAAVYAPLQEFDELYGIETALDKGTVFSKLDLPFMGESVYKGGGCRG